MRALGFDVKKPDVLKILKDYDREATGKITFEDFQEVSEWITFLILVEPLFDFKWALYSMPCKGIVVKEREELKRNISIYKYYICKANDLNLL